MNTWRHMLEVLTLQTYNTRLVVLSTMLLGVSAGLLGVFLLMRKRSLMGDALSHATLPGIALMFILMVAGGGTGKFLPGLLFGAALTGLLGVGMVLWIRHTTRLKDDTAMGIVLSVFFGVGVVLLGVAQSMPQASAAGLETFIYGRTASMVLQDFYMITGVAVAALLCSALFLKEFTILCFDENFARAQGWPVLGLDMLLMLLVAVITVAGLQAVGLILIISFLITPAAAARFWTDRLAFMLILAAIIGGTSGWVGASVSALTPGWPAGAVIVLTAAFFFVISLLFGRARGILPRWFQHARLRRRMGRQHLLRAVYEILESQQPDKRRGITNSLVDVSALLAMRSWTSAELKHWIQQAFTEDHLDHYDGSKLRLSESGFGEAARITRNHRLWETYLITYADVAPQHVDRDADMVEHVLSPAIIQQLEQNMQGRTVMQVVPPSPHRIEPAGESA